MFLWRILLCQTFTMSNIYKILIQRQLYHLSLNSEICNAGPTSRIISSLRRYNLVNIVFHAIETSNYMSKTSWKRLIKTSVREHDNKRQRIMSMLYKSLNRIHWSHSINSWWWVSYNDPSLTKMCVTIIRLLISPGKQEHKICDKCSSFQESNYEHVLFECDFNKSNRILLWKNFIDTCPKPMRKDINIMDVTKKTNFILNGMNGSFTKEWQHIYEQLAKFIYEMWTNYK